MEVTLNRNGWHRKLQEFVFRNPPRYNSLCPYFWLTVFCFIFTFMIPIVPIIKFVPLIGEFFFWILDWIDKNICVPAYQRIIRKMDDSSLTRMWAVWSYEDCDAYIKYANMDDTYRKDWDFWRNSYADVGSLKRSQREKYSERFAIWKKLNPDWESKIEAIKEKRKAEYAKYIADTDKRKHEIWVKKNEREQAARARMQKLEAKMAKRKERKQKVFTNIAIYTKYLAWVLAAIIICLVGFGMYQFCLYIYEHTVLVKFLFFMKWLGITLLGIGAIIGFVFLLVKLITKCKIDLTEIKWLRKIGVPFVYLWKGFVWTVMKIADFFILIGEGFKFVWAFIKNTKDDYCPGIIWEDTTKK